MVSRPPGGARHSRHRQDQGCVWARERCPGRPIDRLRCIGKRYFRVWSGRLSPVRDRLFSRFLPCCAMLLLALAVLQHRSPRLRFPTSFERIGEKKHRARAVQAAILRTRVHAQKAASVLPERAKPSSTPSAQHRTPDPRLVNCAPRMRTVPWRMPPFVTKHIPRMGSEEPPRA